MKFKDTYLTIVFPLEKTSGDAQRILRIYSKEFNFNQESSFELFIIMVLSVLRDFIDKRIDEWQLSSFAFSIFTSLYTRKYISHEYIQNHNKLFSLLNELMDIPTIQETSSQIEYKKYLIEITKEWEDLVKYYGFD